MLLWLLMITNIELFTLSFGRPNCWQASTILGVFIGSWTHLQPLIQCRLLTDVCVRGVSGCLETHTVWRNGCQKCKPGLLFFGRSGLWITVSPGLFWQIAFSKGISHERSSNLLYKSTDQPVRSQRSFFFCRQRTTPGRWSCRRLRVKWWRTVAAPSRCHAGSTTSRRTPIPTTSASSGPKWRTRCSLKMSLWHLEGKKKKRLVSLPPTPSSAASLPQSHVLATR